MGLIKEPLEVDFLVDPRPLTKEQRQAISDFIKADKEKRNQKAKRAASQSARRTKLPA